MNVDAKDPLHAPTIRLAYVEISRFRRLSSVRVAIDANTTILVGANNSGKTSVLVAIRQFLADSPAFGAFDLSVDQWPILRRLGEAWEALDEDPSSDDSNPLPWDQQLQELHACMPTLDLWFNAEQGGYHVVYPFLPSLQWSGGPVGVRLRLEPASSVKELQELAWRFREARQPIRNHDASARAWPTDLIDYWLRHRDDLGRVMVYRLDPAKGPLADTALDAAQELPATAMAVERTHLTQLIRVDFVAAQRGLGVEEADGRPGMEPHPVGLFSNQMLRFAQKHLNTGKSVQGDYPELVKAVAQAQCNLDANILAAMESAIEDVKILGYPGVHDPQELHFRTRIQTTDLLNHGTAVQYRMKGHDAFLPEHAIGLGYQNLQSLSYRLVSFRESRINPTKGSPAAVHLVLVEEPEAHLHVQVQRIFPKRALELITPKGDEHAHLASQLILSTHASHLAHAESFTRLRYVRRTTPPTNGAMPASQVVNLADVFGSDVETRTFAERYFQVQHTDLLFADGAIFVEGTAERMIVPFFIEQKFQELRSRYLSFLEIGGSHAHRIRPLIERLGIPAVVITDIDPVNAVTGEAEAITDPALLNCGNDTLTKWHPQVTCLQEFKALRNGDKLWTNNQGSFVLFAWQEPIPPNGPWPSSFEDAFILTNLDWFKARNGDKGALGQAVRLVKRHQDPVELTKALHDLLHGSFKKGDFAATLFELLCANEPLQCPGYIHDALAWLEQILKPLDDEVSP